MVMYKREDFKHFGKVRWKQGYSPLLRSLRSAFTTTAEDLSEDILTQHETYLNALQAEWDLKSPVISKVQEWFSLAAEETELENRMHDPNRFKKGGAAMLQEEKMRKRVNLLKPKVCSSL